MHASEDTVSSGNKREAKIRFKSAEEKKLIASHKKKIIQERKNARVGMKAFKLYSDKNEVFGSDISP